MTPATGACASSRCRRAGRPTAPTWPIRHGCWWSSDRGAGRLGLTLYDRSSGETWQALASTRRRIAGALDPSAQRIVFFRTASWGLWQADLSLDGPRLVDDLSRRQRRPVPRIVPSAGFYVQSRRLVYLRSRHLDRRHRPGLQRALDRGGAPARSRTGPCLDPRGGELTGVSYDAGNGWLYYSYSTQDASDIGWARLPAAR